MKFSIAKAYNGVHRKYKKYLEEFGHKVKYFDIDGANWLDNVLNSKGDVYIWNADDKYSNYRLILDRVYFVEKYLGKRFFPNFDMYYIFNDKIKQYNILKYLNIPQIETFVTYNKGKALQKAEKANYPVVLKDAHSCEGKGVFKIETKEELIKMIEKIFSPSGFNRSKRFCYIKDYLYLQKFIPDLSKDLRVVTIGDKIAAAYWRISPKGEWKTNLGSGGTVSYSNIPQKALDTCLYISKKMGYDWMSYDCIIRNGKVYIGEFSCNFGVKGATRAGINIRKMQMEYINKILVK